MTQRVIIIAAISVVLSCLLAGFDSEGSQIGRERAVLAAEPLVQTIAEVGPAALFDASARAELRGVDGESSLFALLGAWSKLSLGRIGVLPFHVAEKLPWLVVAGLVPPALYAIVAKWWGTSLAFFAIAWLLALPGWFAASARATDAATLAGACLVTFALYLRSLPRWQGERSRHAHTWMALCVSSLAIGVAMSRAVLLVLLLLYVDFSFRNRALARRTEERGLFLMPGALAFSLGVAPIALVALNPGLYGASPSALVAAVFAPIDIQAFSPWQFALPALAVAGARLSESVCRRFVPPAFTTLAQVGVLALVLATSVML